MLNVRGKKRESELFGKTAVVFIICIASGFLAMQTGTAQPGSAQANFFSIINYQRSLMPPTFKCEVLSDIFINYFEQLPTDAFVKSRKDVKVNLSVSNDTVVINCTGVTNGYVDVVNSYFVPFIEVLNLVIHTQDSFKSKMNDFTVEEKKDGYYLTDKSGLVSYRIVFEQKLLKTISFFQNDVKQMEIGVTYMTLKNFVLPRQVSIENYSQTQKNVSIIEFKNYTL